MKTIFTFVVATALVTANGSGFAKTSHHREMSAAHTSSRNGATTSGSGGAVGSTGATQTGAGGKAGSGGAAGGMGR